MKMTMLNLRMHSNAKELEFATAIACYDTPKKLGVNESFDRQGGGGVFAGVFNGGARLWGFWRG